MGNVMWLRAAGTEPDGLIPVYKPQTSPMAAQRAIEIFAILNFAVIGLSLMMQPSGWAHFFAWLRREGRAGALAYGFVCLSFGSLIVSFHRVWHGVLVLLTIAGWLEVLLGLICLFLPTTGLRIMELPAEGRLGICRLVGLACLVLAAIIFVVLLPGGL